MRAQEVSNRPWAYVLRGIYRSRGAAWYGTATHSESNADPSRMALPVQVNVSGGPAERSVVRLTECVLVGAAHAGVCLPDVGASAVLESCTVKKCIMGIIMRPGTSAHISKTTFAECDAGVTIGAIEDNMTAECTTCGRSAAAGLARVWQQLSAARPAAVLGARCMHEGAVAFATLNDVNICGCSIGMAAHVTGRVDAKNVSVQGAHISYLLARVAGGVPNRFAGCLAKLGNAPSVASSCMLGPQHGYQSVHDAVPGIAVVSEGEPRAMSAVAPVLAGPGHARCDVTRCVDTSL